MVYFEVIPEATTSLVSAGKVQKMNLEKLKKKTQKKAETPQTEKELVDFVEKQKEIQTRHHARQLLTGMLLEGLLEKQNGKIKKGKRDQNDR